MIIIKLLINQMKIVFKIFQKYLNFKIFFISVNYYVLFKNSYVSRFLTKIKIINPLISLLQI